MKILKHLIAFAFLLGISSMASAAVPPPPVNQNIGIPDTVFSFQNPDVCNNCHGGNAPIGVPVNPALNVDRHHKKVGEMIDGQPDWPPFPDIDGDGAIDPSFKCTNCHTFAMNPATGEQEIVQNFRNCLNCHVWNAGDTSVHHKTPWAQEGTCFQCHGGIVRGVDPVTLLGKKPDPLNPGQTVPVTIGTYGTSAITPWRSGKPDGDDRIVSSAGTNPGNCNFCHNTGDGLAGAPTGGTPEAFTLQDGTTTTIGIFTNVENHHGTGFANEGKCAWCHIQDGANQAGTIQDEIKSCQRCHDVPTLHNIEFDAVGDGTQVGQEQAYFGHIGNNANCWGCHGNNISAASITNQNTDSTSTISGNVSTAIVPTLSSLSVQSIPERTDVIITATGTSFVNTALITPADGEPYNFTYTSEVMITDQDGNVTMVEPITIDRTSLTFKLPETLATGTYYVAIKKAFQHTNPIPIVITPKMIATHSFIYTPYGSMVVLIGSGFVDSHSMYGVVGGGTTLVDQNGTPPSIVYMWDDNMIIAHFSDDPESVTVTNIYGEETFTLDRY